MKKNSKRENSNSSKMFLFLVKRVLHYLDDWLVSFTLFGIFQPGPCYSDEDIEECKIRCVQRLEAGDRSSVPLLYGNTNAFDFSL